MQSIVQSLLLGLTTDKLLHDLQLFFSAGFESARVVENITGVALEDQFVIDLM
jgi:hypothetical protein